ncbi:MAG: hypothetical protein ACYTJ0_08545 [Planctomycetota bacterium]
MVRLLGRCPYGRPDRIEVDVGEAREYGGVVEKGLDLESTVPEVTGDVVLPIGSSGNGLLEALHEPAEACEALSPEGDAAAIGCEPPDEFAVAVDVAGPANAFCGSRVEHDPPAHDLLVGPVLGPPGLCADQQVQVIVHDGEGADLDGEAPAELE